MDKHTGKKYYKIYNKASKLIESSLKKLVMNDGTFAQYSTVYHRMVLDLCSVLELLRSRWGNKTFSDIFYKKIKLALEWYVSMIDPVSGGMPNIGGNDGTYLFNFDHKLYRDFRPSISLASSVFKISFEKENEIIHILQEIFEIKNTKVNEFGEKHSKFLEGGFLKLSRKNGSALLRVPKYKFRPAHSDALHIDIWQDGVNWIRDAGSFSYAEDTKEQDCFSGVMGHSTAVFNNENQMPRLSRFLFGGWLKPYDVNFSSKKKPCRQNMLIIKKICI